MADYQEKNIGKSESQLEMIKKLEPSQRGGLEITDLNNFYVDQGTATYEILKGFWGDAGKFESLFESSQFMRKKNSH